MAKQDFGNGLQYDSDTGEVVIKDTTGSEVYRYDPNASGGGHTYYGGQSYVGRYNPAVMGLMTGEQLQSAYDPLIANQNKYINAPTDTTKGSAANYWQNLGQNPADHIAFNSAYFKAQDTASAEDKSFFDTLKSMAGQRQTQPAVSTTITPGTTAVAQPAPQTTELAKAITPQPAVMPTPQIATPEQHKTISSQPVSAQEQAPASDTSATEPKAQPDYSGFLKAMYDQVSPYLASLSTPQQPAKPDNSAYSSKPFSLGTQNASPDFKSGGYNPQPGYGSTPSGASGKSSTSQPSGSQGMATGQFGSK